MQKVYPRLFCLTNCIAVPRLNGCARKRVIAPMHLGSDGCAGPMLDRLPRHRETEASFVLTEPKIDGNERDAWCFGWAMEAVNPEISH